MTRAYVLDAATRTTLGLVDQSWERLAYNRRYTAMDTFELVIHRSRLWASELVTGRLLYLPDEGDLVFHIEQIASTAEGSTRNDEMTVSGRSLEGIAMAERLVEPPAGESHDRQTGVAAETAIKHYLRSHAGDLAAPARQVPGLVVAADAARGPAVTVNGRYQSVLDLVREIALVAGLGWEITYDAASGDFAFDVVDGVDRSSSVFFDFAFETLERWEELTSVIDAKTVALVAGQGEGTDRDVVTRWSGTEPAGFERREAFLDARDVEQGETTVLAQRGDAYLAATGAETSLEARVHQYGGFRYREHWDVGDVVTVRNAERGLAYAARIVEVQKAFERSAAAPVITATLGRPFPTLASQASAGRAAATADGAVGLAGRAAGGVLAGTYPNPAFAVDMATQAELVAAIAAGGSAGPDANDTIDAAGAAGTAGTYARAAHGHRVNTTAGPGADVTVDAAGAAGATGALARATHGHKLATASGTPAADTVAGSAGTSGAAPARGDHAHPAKAPIRRVYLAAASPATWTKPAGLAFIEVEVQAGGGSGGGNPATASGTVAASAGGGGGGYTRKLLTAADLAAASSATVTIGDGAAAPAAGANAGSAGGTSSFAATGISTVSATGGGGGGAGAAESTAGPGPKTPGSGGSGSGGDVTVSGGDGGAGTTRGGEYLPYNFGGASFMGGTTRGSQNSAGIAGNTYGGGGSGTSSGNSVAARSGGAGAAGIVIVTEHYL